MTQDLALSRLRDSDHPAAERLARLIVDETTATPLAELASARFLASQLATALEAVTSESARAWVHERMAVERTRWSAEDRSLRTWLPSEAEQPLRELLGRPWSPDEELVLRVIDQEVVRDLISDLLTDSLTRFGRRLRSIDKSMLGGLGGRAARSAVRRSKGLFGTMVGEGAVENLVGAVAEEFELQLERRVRDFVGRSTQDSLRRAARHLASPDHAEAYGEVRLAVLDVVLDSPIRRLTAEADKLDPEELVEVLRAAVHRAVSEPGFVPRAEERIAAILERTGDGTLGAWLAEVGLLEVWSDTTTELVAARLRAVFATDGFGAWWEELFAAP